MGIRIETYVRDWLPKHLKEFGVAPTMLNGDFMEISGDTEMRIGMSDLNFLVTSCIYDLADAKKDDAIENEGYIGD